MANVENPAGSSVSEHTAAADRPAVTGRDGDNKFQKAISAWRSTSASLTERTTTDIKQILT